MYTYSQILTSLLIILITYYAKKALSIYKLYKRLQKKSPFNPETDIKTRFSLSKIPPKIDALILGAGCSGLSCASVLAKMGKKVVVLEQAGKAGGGLHVFKQNGFEFDAGFHYVGGKQQQELVFNLLGNDKIEFNIFKNYDRIMHYNEIFDFVAPETTFFQNLTKRFPNNEKEISKYRHLLLKRSPSLFGLLVLNALFTPAFLQSIVLKILSIIYSDIYYKTVEQVLNDIGIKRESQLFAVINGIYGDFGVLPDKFPFIMHCGLMGHYIKDGSLYPKQGLRHVVKSIVSQINSNGGQVLTRAKVNQICIKNGKVYGVNLEGGQMVRSNTIISTMGLWNTNEAMTPGKYKFGIDLPYQECFTTVSVFLGVEAEKGTFPTHNIWYHPIGGSEQDYDIFKPRDAQINQGNLDKMTMFFSFPTAKMNLDTNQQSVQIIAEVSADEFLPYKINTVQRKEGYKELKEKYEKKMIEKFLELFPQCKGKIVQSSTGTPLSNENFLNRLSIYGMENNRERLFNLKHFLNFQRAEVKGLWVAGQDLAFPSITGNMLQGILVALKVGKYL